MRPIHPKVPADALVYGKIVLTSLYLVAFSPFWLATTLGLAAVESWAARLALGGFLAALALPLALVWCAGRRIRAGLGVSVACAALLAGAWTLRPPVAPPGNHAGPVAAYSVEFGSGGAAFPWDPMPEIDWIRAGGAAGAAFAVTPDQARYLVRASEEFDAAMTADPDFAALPSQMPRAVKGLLGRDGTVGHYVLLTPTPGSPKRKGMVVFLHGSAGNFRAYAWLLRDVTLTTGWDVVIPTYGFGDWNRPDGLAAIEAAVADARSKADYGTGGVVAAGVSNGGRGLTRLIAFGDVPLKSAVFISPVMESAVMETPEFVARAKGLPVTVVHGLRDDRIPAPYVEYSRQLLVKQGADVHAVPFPEGDHFILFSQSGAILKEIEMAVTEN